MLKVICGWCLVFMYEIDGEGVEGTSHGMCTPCYEKEIKDLGLDKIRNLWYTSQGTKEK